MLASKRRRLEESGLVTRVCVHIVRHALALISLLADAGLSFAAVQMKLDATYKATLLGLPIGQMSWSVEIHDNRFESVAKGRSPGSCGSFWMCRARSRLTGLCPAENRSPRISHLGSWPANGQTTCALCLAATRRRNMSPPRQQIRARTLFQSRT